MARPRPTKWIEIFHEFIVPLRIVSKEISSATDERGTPLELWESQQRFLTELAAGLEDGVRTFICLKSRQLGVTTISLVIDLFWCLMYPGTRGALVTDTEANRDENRLILEGYFRSFPANYFGPGLKIVKHNRSFMEFSNGSRLTFLVAGVKKKGVSWAEGKGISFAHITEVSKYGDPAALKSFQESLAQKNPDRLFIYESTANGYNHFRDMWFEGKRDTNTLRTFFIGWWASNVNRIERTDRRFAEYGSYPPSGDERERVKLVREQYGYVIKPEQLAWIRWKESDQTQDQHILAQNQPWIEQDAFQMTGYSFFQTRYINQKIQAMDEAPVDETTGRTEFNYDAYRYELGNDFFAMTLVRCETEEERPRIELKVWEKPHPEGKYVIGFDPAYGRTEHKDRSVISVWRCFADKLVQVAEYATNMVELKQVTWCAAHIAGAYKDCLLNVEITGPGRLVMDEFDHVRGLMKADQFAKFNQDRNWTDALDCARWFIYVRQDSMMKGGGVLNFETTSRTKPEIMHGFRGAFMTNELALRSKFLLFEMQQVVQDGWEIGAPDSSNPDCKDDRVIAAALAWRAWSTWIRPMQIANNETYERIMGEENGSVGAHAQRVNDVVYNFFRSQQERAESIPPRGPKWMTDRGLL